MLFICICAFVFFVAVLFFMSAKGGKYKDFNGTGDVKYFRN